jgi:OFA family oxalate/formate antiporter-like MFS transporter
MSNMSEATVKNRGWLVTFSAMAINLALGVLYTWSVISKGIPEAWHWTEAQKSLPYAVACLVFSIMMVPAGRLQDKIGPRITATIGGILVGLGMVITSMSTTPMLYIIGFGVLVGTGLGFGYGSATPPAVKWFPAKKTGLIAGIVVSGFGLASVYTAPLSNWLIATQGMQKALFLLGLLFFAAVVIFAQFLKTPPAGFVAAKPAAPAPNAAPVAVKRDDFRPSEMLATPQFYLLWFMYACGAGAGLMVIAKLAVIVKVQAGISLGFVLVVMLAIGNGGGRILAGMVSDKIGRQKTMLISFLLQACLVFLLSKATSGSPLANIVLLSILSALIGANYGANLSLFPSITKDYWGLKNFGINYGLLFTAWGMGGFMLAFYTGKLYDKYHTFAYAYYGACILLILASVVSLFVKAPAVKHRTA